MAGKPRSSRSARGVMVLLGLLLAGCGGKTLTPAKVSGQVLGKNKQPLAKVIVKFHPLEETNKSNAPSAVTDEKGHFTLEGLPGRYKVTIFSVPLGRGQGSPDTGSLPGAEKSEGPFRQYGKYENLDLTPWEVQVPQQGVSDLKLEMS
jgi:hypothetical protein